MVKNAQLKVLDFPESDKYHLIGKILEDRCTGVDVLHNDDMISKLSSSSVRENIVTSSIGLRLEFGERDYNLHAALIKLLDHYRLSVPFLLPYTQPNDNYIVMRYLNFVVRLVDEPGLQLRVYSGMPIFIYDKDQLGSVMVHGMDLTNHLLWNVELKTAIEALSAKEKNSSIIDIERSKLNLQILDYLKK